MLRIINNPNIKSKKMTIISLIKESFPEWEEDEQAEIAFQTAIYFEVPGGENHYHLTQEEIYAVTRWLNYTSFPE